MKKITLLFLFVSAALYSFAQTVITDDILTIEEPKPIEIKGTPKDLVICGIEVKPEFPGGEQKMREFIAENIYYPKEAKKNKIQGKVYVRFMVDELGDIQNVSVLRAAHGLLATEAVRVIEMMPRWKPGTQGGKAVRVWFTLPIDFTLR